MKEKLLAAKRELIGEINQLRSAVNGTFTAEQRTAADQLKDKLETVDKDLAREELFARAEEKQPAEPVDGAKKDWMTRCREFSLTRAIASACGHKVDDGAEREVQDEMRRRSGQTYEGMPVPIEALEERAVSTTTPSGGPGSRVIGTDYRPGDYIPLLRNQLMTPRLGIRTLRGLEGNVSIPKAAGATSVGWKGESGAFDATDPTFDTPITMTPKKLGAIGQYSQRMILQSSPGIEELVRQDLAAVMAREIDRAVLFGTGSNNQPTGLFNGVTPLGIATNGGPLTLDLLHSLILRLSDDNVGMSSRAFATNMAVALSAARTLTFSSAGSDTLYQDGTLAGVPTFTSNLIPSDGTKGSGSSLSTLLYAEWSDGLIGMWQELDVLVNPYATAAYNQGAVQIRVMAHLDVAKRYDESFEQITDITTT